MPPKKRITILGSSGFIGSHLLNALKQKHVEVYAPDLDGAINSRDDLGSVIYCIGLTSDFRSRPFDTVEAHVCILRKLLTTSRFSSFTYLSSTRVYGCSVDTSEMASLKVDPSKLEHLYNLSKLTGEALVLNSGIPLPKVVRLSNVVGLREDSNIFIDQILKEGLDRGFVELQTSFESIKDYIYIDDVISLIYAISVHSEPGIFNVASGEQTSHAELVDLITRKFGFPVKEAPGAPTSVTTLIDTCKIKAVFRYSPSRFGAFFPAFLNAYCQRMRL